MANNKAPGQREISPYPGAISPCPKFVRYSWGLPGWHPPTIWFKLLTFLYNNAATANGLIHTVVIDNVFASTVFPPNLDAESILAT